MGMRAKVGNQTAVPDIYTDMEPTWPRRRVEPDAPLIRLDPGGWWALVVAATLVVALIIGPLTVLALSRDLDSEVTTQPDATVPDARASGAGGPAAGPPG
jgi:hypothetical protein